MLNPKGLAESNGCKGRRIIEDDCYATARQDRSIIFKETLLDAAITNEFGFKEQDVLPLFVKYQSKRQILIDLLSFLTYVVQLPTRFYLRRSRNSRFVLKNNRDRWFKTIGNINDGTSF